MADKLKICFVMQRQFAFIAHDLAIHLKNRYGVQEFCGYVYTRSSMRFLTSQKDINYSALLLEEDLDLQARKEKLDLNYIAYLEKEYGLPNLWPYIEVDRIYRYSQLVREYPMDQSHYTHEELMTQVQVRAKAIIAMLENQRPDYLFCSVVGGMGSLLLYHIAKKMGIKVRMILSGRVGSRYVLSEHYDSFSFIDAELDQLMTSGQKADNFDEAQKILETFRANPKSYVTTTNFYLQRAGKLKQLDFLTPKKLLKYVKWLSHDIKNYFLLPDKHDYSYIHPLLKVKDQIARKLRVLQKTSDLYDTLDMDHEDFAFFPMHLEPEASLLLNAPNYANQLEVIKQVARSLPVHFKLYVKDHPRMIGYRTRQYYQELKKIKNVKLVYPKMDSLQLIAKSKLVTIISGSGGWEALELKKPVITMGGVFYNKLPMVKRCHSYEDLPAIVNQQLYQFEHNDEALVNYIALILKHSVALDLRHLWHRETDDQKKLKDVGVLADLIAKHIGL